MVDRGNSFFLGKVTRRKRDDVGVVGYIYCVVEEGKGGEESSSALTILFAMMMNMELPRRDEMERNEMRKVI